MKDSKVLGGKSDTLNIKNWADARFEVLLSEVQNFIKDGWSVADAFHVVMDKSTLGAGYRAQMRKELGLGIFD